MEHVFFSLNIFNNGQNAFFLSLIKIGRLVHEISVLPFGESKIKKKIPITFKHCVYFIQ